MQWQCTLQVSVTLKREFGEEALNSEGLDPEQRATVRQQVDQLFRSGVEVRKAGRRVLHACCCTPSRGCGHAFSLQGTRAFVGHSYCCVCACWLLTCTATLSLEGCVLKCRNDCMPHASAGCA
jgi:hypothetical protein